MVSMKWWGFVPLALILYAAGCNAQCDPPCASIGATCMDDTMGNFMCTCNAGYTGNGITCQDIDECTDNPNVCHMNADCSNTPGSYDCTCRPGYTGDGVTCAYNEPPQFQAGSCPSDINEVAEAGKSVKMVTWTHPSASDTTGDDPMIACTPQSGSDFMIGTHEVICTATDAAGNQATPNCIFEVTVTDYDECTMDQNVCDMNAVCNNTEGGYSCTCKAGYIGDGATCTDNEPPQFQAGSCPSDINEVAEAGKSVKKVTWTNPLASDTTGDDPTIACSPQSAGDFMIGTHEVICTATDAAGNQATTNCVFTVTVTDYDECTMDQNVCDMNAVCTNTEGGYSCTCKAGYIGDGATCTDIEPPQFQDGTCPSDINEVAEAEMSVKMVTWTNPSASDTTGDDPTIACTPQSGSDFMIGTREVICTATDAAGNQATPNCVFTVTVTDYDECTMDQNDCDMNAVCNNTEGSYSCTCKAGYNEDGTMCTDNEPPQFQDESCPSDINEVAEAEKSVKMVNWTNPSASDTTGDDPTIACTPQSGSNFMIGTRDVICTATDAAGNQATPNCDFTVTVTDKNECEDDPSVCHMNADCTNTPGSYECSCRAGFTGDGVTCTECDDGKYGLNCASECSCVSRGTCNKVTGECTCASIPGFSDAVCDKDDFQVSLTRADGTTGPVLDTGNKDNVELICTVNVLPADLVGSVLIRYPDGNEYPTTLDPNQFVYRETVMDVHPRNSGDYTCLTKIQPRPSDSIIDKTSVYSLSVVDLDECATNEYTCDVNAYCVNENMNGGYDCLCNSGYRFVPDDGVTCEDIDECTDATVTHNCVTNADCNNTNGSFICTCKPGFFGNGDSSCQVCNQGNYGLGCTKVCTCVAPVPGENDVTCNNVDGTCSCNQEFTDKACDKHDLNVILTPSPFPVLDTKGVDNVTLICSINLHSRDLESANITFQNGSQITGTALSNSSEGRYERTLYDLSPSDSARYRCTATTSINGLTRTIHGDLDLDVLAPGRIISVTEKVEGEMGATVAVDCVVYADPAPNITWYDPDSMVITNDGMKYTVSSTTDEGRLTSSLTVKNLVRNDNGSYKCETQNDLTDEKDQQFAEVVIIEVPEVGNVAASPVSSESIDVTWQVTNDGNLPIFQCRVAYREAPTGTWIPSTPNPPQQSKSHHVTGLAAFTSYSIQVTCSNRVGDGISSILNNPVRTKQAAPSAPRNPIVTEFTFENLTVAWDEPAMKRGTIAFYRVSVEGVLQTYQTPDPGNPAPLSLLVSGLSPYTDYSLSVTAFNVEGGNELMGEDSMSITKRTAESTPTFPLDVELNNTGKTCVVSWDRPSEENGIILTYMISRLAHFYPTVETQNDLIPDMDKTDEVEVTGDQRSYSINKIDLQPYARYKFAITASTTVGKGPQSAMTVATCDSPPSAPPDPSMPMVAMVEERITANSFWMALEETSLIHGPISCYDIIVVRIEKDAKFNHTDIDPNKQYPQASIMTYDESQQKAGAYRAVVKNGMRLPEMLEIGVSRISTCDDVNSSGRKKRATSEVHIGDNGPLLPETEYSAFLRAFVELDDGTEVYSSSPLMSPIKTAPGASPVGIIVGVILAILVIIVIVLVILIYVRRREMPLLHDRENGYSMEPVMGHEKEQEFTHMVVLPTAIEELPEKVKQKGQNEDEVFKNEFKSIPESTGSVTREASQMECNKEKNRYINITAYDQTRVKLLETKGVEGSDYINACYVDGYEKPKKFIAAQGPREDTVLDFWRMMWEQNCSTVIMLTKCLENGREKCAEYWPEEDAIMYDDIIVTLDDVVTCADYVIRKFTMQKSIEGEEEDEEPVLGESRILMQFHFLGWPDFGVPKYPHSLLCFIKRIRHMSGNRTDPGNTVIHCSAGVGRTGTYILIDSMLDMMKKEKKVDIYNLIYKLRSQRNLLVQSLVQYILIHKALAEEYLFGHTEVDVGSLHMLFQKLSKKDPDNDFTGLDQEYRTLASLPVENKDQKGGNIEANKHKNRLRQVIPYDFNRVKLERLTGQEHSNYINASFIDGYEHKKAYIAAQGPLPNTMGDFWRLAWENQCSTIVMMSGCEEKGQTVCSQYWPGQGETVNHAFLTVTVKDEKQVEDCTIRDLEVSTTKGGGTKLIRQYHFRGWPEVGSPETAATLIKVIGLVYDYQHDIGRFPILVHCSAGSGRTGVFIALSFLLQRAKAEGIVDIFQTVRSLRQQRPHMVQDLEQYQFCYRAMLEYLDSFDHYANFK